MAKLLQGQCFRRNMQQVKTAGAVVEAGAKEQSPIPEQPWQRNALNSDGEEKEDAVAAPSENSRRADLLVCGCWSPKTDCWIDFVMTDINHPSYRSRTPAAVLRSHKQRKKIVPC